MLTFSMISMYISFTVSLNQYLHHLCPISFWGFPISWVKGQDWWNFQNPHLTPPTIQSEDVSALLKVKNIIRTSLILMSSTVTWKIICIGTLFSCFAFNKYTQVFSGYYKGPFTLRVSKNQHSLTLHSYRQICSTARWVYNRTLAFPQYLILCDILNILWIMFVKSLAGYFSHFLWITCIYIFVN